MFQLKNLIGEMNTNMQKFLAQRTGAASFFERGNCVAQKRYSGWPGANFRWYVPN